MKTSQFTIVDNGIIYSNGDTTRVFNDNAAFLSAVSADLASAAAAAPVPVEAQAAGTQAAQ